MFKLANAQIFEAADDWPLPTQDALMAMAAERPFEPCSPHQAVSVGFVPPLQAPDLHFIADQALLLTLCIEQKTIPASTLSERLQEKIEQEEQQINAKVGRERKAEIRETLIMEMLPQVLPKRKRVQILFDYQDSRMLIDAASKTQGEDVVSLIREYLGTLKVRPLSNTLQGDPAATMTRWMMFQNFPDNIAPEGDCVLQWPDAKSSHITCKQQELLDQSIIRHIENGMQVARLRLRHDDNLALTLHDDMQIRRIVMLDKLADTIIDDLGESESVEDRFFASFMLVINALREAIGDICDAIDAGQVERAA